MRAARKAISERDTPPVEKRSAYGKFDTLFPATSVFNKHIFDFTFHLVGGKIYRPFSGDNQDVLAGNDLVTIPAETFSEKPLHSVSANRISHLRTHGYAEPGLSAFVRLGDDQKMGGMELFPPTRQAQKLRPFSQTGLLRKVRPASHPHPSF